MATRKPAPRKEPPPKKANLQPAPSPEELRRQIAEAAYYKAKARGFAPGGEVQDWMEAEAEVMRRLGRAP